MANKKIGIFICMVLGLLPVLIPGDSYGASVAGGPNVTVSANMMPEKPRKPDSREWVLLSDDFYVSKTKPAKSSDNLSVRTYRMIKDSEKNYLIDYFRESDFQKSVRYRSLDHQVIFLKFDCRKKSSRIEKLINYDQHDNVLYEETYPNAEWSDIISSSKMEEAYQKVCVASPDMEKKKSPKKKHKVKKTKKGKQTKKAKQTAKASTKK